MFDVAVVEYLDFMDDSSNDLRSHFFEETVKKSLSVSEVREPVMAREYDDLMTLMTSKLSALPIRSTHR